MLRLSSKKPSTAVDDGVPFFDVQLRKVPAEIDAGDERIVFHGVNKSGSGMLTEVLYKSFIRENRLDDFYSFYQGKPADAREFREILMQSPGGRKMLFVDHYLYGTRALKRVDHALISMFRHPMPRVVSCYFWSKKRHAESEFAATPFPSLEKWVVETEGKQHSQIAQFGIGFSASRARAMKRVNSQQLYHRAMVNIERDVRWFGIAEYFEESIFMAAHLCGLKAVPAWRQDNRNKGRTLVHDLPRSTLLLIRDVFRYDFKLYRDVREIFRERIARIDFGDSLAAYKAACADQYKDRLI